jgi:2-polyprenyl-3-methyl-5-hydroxy-6-metoxy-1,4-benzoquinol methylase
MDSEYGRQYRALYERHWWWRAREAVILRTLRELLPSRRAGKARILDVGCGDGLFFEKLAEFGDVEGVEADAALVSDSPNRARITIGPFDARYQSGHRFRVILMLDVLEHLDDPVAALRHAGSLLEPDGILLATVPAFRALWTTHDAINQHRTRYTRRTLSAVAAAAGLRVSHMEYFFHWTFPAKMLQRGLERIVRPHPAPPRVPPAPINVALYTASRLEYALLRPLHLAFGSSLLMVARRAC